MERQSDNIKEWRIEGKRRKSKGFVDMCDTFSYEHYPIFYGGLKDDYKTANEIIAAKDGKNMQRSFGVFKL